MNLQKDILAKLLATENVTVLHESVKTASFDVKNRVLRLPQWDDMQSFTYDHLVGHEVGHALYTPFDGWHDSATARGPAFKSFLNVIEDARIEKLVQRKYPGLRNSFIRSYKKMFAEGFFGDNKEIGNFNLIDRINVYFKCGESFGVPFTVAEKKWVEEIRSAETWEQVVDIATRMYDSQLKAAEEQMSDYDGLDEDGEDYQDEDVDGGSFGGSDDDDVDSEESEEGEGEEEVESDEQTHQSSAEKAIQSKTDEELRENMESMSKNDDPRIQNVRVGALNAEPYIIGYKTIVNYPYDTMLHAISEYSTSQWVFEKSKNADDESSRLYNEFLSNNRKTISYLVKEFEMKKSAAQYARATLAKTGVIDPVKMNNYKFSEDIFRKVSVVPDGKNHGVVMYLDWSGSMFNDLYNTVIQTLNLVHFCRQVNIPYRVYAFTDNWHNTKHEEKLISLVKNPGVGFATVAKRGYALLEWFSNKMNKSQFREASKKLLFISKNIHHIRGDMMLGGTPLDTTIIMAMDIHNKFKKQNRLDIVNTIFLTDGDSHCAEYLQEYGTEGGVYSTDIRGRMTRIVDDVTKKQYKNGKSVYAATETLLKMYKDRTGSNAIGFRIIPSSKGRFINEFADYSGEKWATLLKEKYVSLEARGYSKLFLIRGGKHLEVEAGEIAVDRGAAKGKLTTAFKKAAKGKITSRTLLNEFIQQIA